MAELPDHLKLQQTHVSVLESKVAHTSAHDSADSFAALKVDNKLDLKSFKQDMSINIISRDDDNIEFDLIGVAPAVANALRRVLISEVPTMAISKCKLYQNTSIIQDEVLAHRLGLLPLVVNPRDFEFTKEGDAPSDKNTLVFTLDVKCLRKPQSTMAEYTANPEQHSTDAVIYADAIKWVPQGDQATRLSAPVVQKNPRAIVAKLRDGQSIEAELWATKGIGQTHAKFSPVATASYRLLPEPVLENPVGDKVTVTGAAAEKIKSVCPMKVFDIEDGELLVARPRVCTMCRECIRDEDNAKFVKLRRKRNHFIFSVETTGAYTAQEVVTQALGVLTDKCDVLLQETAKLKK